MNGSQTSPLRMLSISNAAEETGLPRETIYRLCTEGEIICRRAGTRGRTLWVVWASLRAWVYGLPQPVEDDASGHADNVRPLARSRGRKL